MHCCAEYLEERSNCQLKCYRIDTIRKKTSLFNMLLPYFTNRFHMAISRIYNLLQFHNWKSDGITWANQIWFSISISLLFIPSVCLVYAMYLGMWKSLKIFFQFLSFNIYFYVCFAIVNLEEGHWKCKSWFLVNSI